MKFIIFIKYLILNFHKFLIIQENLIMEPTDVLDIYNQIIENPDILMKGKEYLENIITNNDGFGNISC